MTDNTNAIIQEFTGITNYQAFQKAWKERMMRLMPDNPLRYLGHTHRDDSMPYLQQEIDRLSNNAKILDLGGGNGDWLNLIDVKNDCRIDVEEPNPIFRERYLEKLEKHPRLHAKNIYELPMQHYFNNPAEFSNEQYDLILILQCIYFFSDQDSSQSEFEQLQNIIKILAEKLNIGGRMNITYTALPLDGAPQYWFEQQGLSEECEYYNAAITARDQLFEQGEIVNYLNAQQIGNYKIEAKITDSCWCGDTVEDLAAMSMLAILPTDDKPFDINKLHCALDFYNTPKGKALTFEETRDVPQKGMYGQPSKQVICTIERID